MKRRLLAKEYPSMLYEEKLTRRQACGLAISSLGLVGTLGAGPGEPVASLHVVETAGLRRYGYPVHTRFPATLRSGNYRLVRDGKAVPAQFRTIVDPQGRALVALDFNASPGPLETETYEVVPNDQPEPALQAGRGMHTERVKDGLRVANGSVLSYVLPGTLEGFLSSVVNGKTEYLQPESEGLCLRTRSGETRRVGGGSMKATVTREGPIAVGLRFDGLAETGGGRSVRSTVEATFPNSKSWVEASWEIDDTDGDVTAMGLDLRLKVEGRPTLVDLGAGSIVYAQLRDREQIELEGGASSGQIPSVPWVVRKGSSEPLPDMARAVPVVGSPGEGWAHVMDNTRCTAVAIAGFGGRSLDRIRIDAQGRLQIWRTFNTPVQAPVKGKKTLGFWLHFVPMPVQVGAATSPQAMQAPLDVTQKVY